MFRSRLTRMTLPTVGDVPIDKVDASDIRSVIARARSTSEAKKAIREMGHVLNHGIAHDLRTDNPVPQIQKSIKAPTPVHRKYMEPDALRKALPRISKSDAPDAIKNFLTFVCYVPVRLHEASRMRWSELNGNQWTIPRERMGKTKQPFLVPLPPFAMNLLKTLPKHSDYVFANEKTGKPYNAVSITTHKDRVLPEMDLHGTRSTFETWAAMSGEDTKMAERCLSHVTDGKVTQAYQRYEYANEKAEILERYSHYLSRAPAGGSLEKFFQRAS